MNNDSIYSILWDVRATLHAILNVLRPPRRVTPNVTISGPGIYAVTIEGDCIMATVVKTGGPLEMDVSDFVSDKGNPVTSSDPAVYTSSDDSVATVVNDPNDAQDGIIALTGKVTDPEVVCVITATFSPKFGPPFSVVGQLIVIEEVAANAQAKITGPGVVDGA
jgi:hypothetical protein